VGYAITARGLALVVPKLPRLDTVTSLLAVPPPGDNSNISVRICRQADINNGLNSLRIDALHGGMFFGDYCVKVISAV